jgi:hypothetical protein
MRDSEEAADRLPPFLLPDANAQKNPADKRPPDKSREEPRWASLRRYELPTLSA